MSRNIGRFIMALNIASASDDNSKDAISAPPYAAQALYEVDPSKATKFSAANAILYKFNAIRIWSSKMKPPMSIKETKDANRR